MEFSEKKSPSVSETIIQSWLDKYELELNQLFASGENLTIDDVIEVLFQKGILDRLAPQDEGTKYLRMKEKRPLWKGNRDEALFYSRLFYAVEFSKESLRCSADFSWVNAWGLAFRKIMANEILDKKFFGDVKNKETAELQFLGKLQKRILQEYNARGGNKDLLPIKIGSRAIYHLIPITPYRG